MKKSNRCLLFTLLIFTVLFAVSGTVFAADKSDFIVENGVLKSYVGPDTVLDIPDDLGITAIGDYAFEGNRYTLVSVTIPEGVTSIGNYAFFACGKLKSVIISNGVTAIGGGAFESCSQLESVVIPDGVTTIGGNAFSSCSQLKSLKIPDSVNSVGAFAFSGTAISEPLFINSGETLCYVPAGFTDYTIPATVKEIGGGAFAYCKNMTSIAIPKGVVSIGDHAFGGCGDLTKVEFPNSVTSIGAWAFASCENLNSLIIPVHDKISSVGEYAFYKTAFTQPIILNDGRLLCHVPKSFTDYTIPSTVTEISVKVR